MSITYRQHQDTRDGKIYNCVLMPDGKWWSAENLAYNIAGSRVYADTPANEPIYGRLYNYELFTYAIMPGAHLPSALEFGRMINAVQAITGVNSAGTQLKSTDLWVSGAGTDSFGFDARPAGRFIPIYNYGALGYVAYFASSELPGSPVSMSMVRYDEPGMTTTGLYEGDFVSVRFIVDVFNEPIPPTKIKGAFSGSGVKVFCTNYNTATFELPISAQTTTELTIDKDFITNFGPFLGNVRILVVDGEYISDWKDWNFNA